MYVDASPVTARRSADTTRLRSARREAGRRPTAATRRTRLADAIVSQWLLEQLPSDHRRLLARSRRSA